MLENDQKPPRASTWEDVAAFLRSKAAYPGGQAPQVIETHISLVFLTDTLVYKLKRPVHFDFLDFATPEARRRACEQEVTLNRRLAADVYLGTVPVTVSESGALAIGGVGQPVEWIVKMRRLPHERMLDAMIEGGNAEAIDIPALAATLVQFYRDAVPVAISTNSLIQCITGHINGNLKELLRPEHRLPETLVKRIHGRQLQFVNLETDLFEARVKNKRIVDGHGDLRPEHICMEQKPVIFDCIEFNDEYRQLDAVDELCFLVMECERMNAKGIGDEIVRAYSKATDDHPPPRLIDFYKSYRACVRAKVATLKSGQSGDREAYSLALAKSYLQLADSSFGPTSQPLCVIVRGLVGTGKTTVASALASTLGMEILQTDKIRREMLQETRESGAYGTGRYTSENRIAVYERMLDYASARLSERISVILDACFLSQDLQQRVRALTETTGVPLLIVDCQCPDTIATERIIARSRGPEGLSEALPEHLMAQKQDDEGAIANAPVLSIDTSVGTTSSQVRAVTRQLRRLVKGANVAITGSHVTQAHVASDVKTPSRNASRSEVIQ